jgi:hypothetical protein
MRETVSGAVRLYAAHILIVLAVSVATAAAAPAADFKDVFSADLAGRRDGLALAVVGRVRGAPARDRVVRVYTRAMGSAWKPAPSLPHRMAAGASASLAWTGRRWCRLPGGPIWANPRQRSRTPRRTVAEAWTPRFCWQGHSGACRGSAGTTFPRPRDRRCRTRSAKAVVAHERRMAPEADAPRGKRRADARRARAARRTRVHAGERRER